MKIIDISVGLHSIMPRWPNSPQFTISWFKRIQDGDLVDNSTLFMDSHSGTHVDAPSHFLCGGKSVDDLDLETLMGHCVVIHLPEAQTITAEMLYASKIPSSTERLLVKTRNSGFWASKNTEFHHDFVALNEEAAGWLVGHGIKLVGVDYLSVQGFHNGPRVHEILLKAEVIILEGLDLSQVKPGNYELICLPLKVKGAEGAPARAVLRVS